MSKGPARYDMHVKQKGARSRRKARGRGSDRWRCWWAVRKRRFQGKHATEDSHRDSLLLAIVSFPELLAGASLLPFLSSNHIVDL